VKPVEIEFEESASGFRFDQADGVESTDQPDGRSLLTATVAGQASLYLYSTTIAGLRRRERTRARKGACHGS
jgi:hypothetical protein